MQLPTLVIAGAQKCGTSTLAATLRKHPQVFMSNPKELHYFDRRYRKGLDYYKAHFTPGPGEVHAGEATPVYMYDPDARRRMAETIPDAKIVVILRNPVTRAHSNYWHERRLGRESLESFEEALARETERRGSGLRMDRVKYSYVDRGRYLDQILPLADAHGRDNLHVMLLDDLTRERVPTLSALFEFLDIERSAAETLEAQWTNKYRFTTDQGTIETAQYPPISPTTRERLVEVFREDNQRLATWLGRDLSHWSRTDG